jgi:hypothetical protein
MNAGKSKRPDRRGLEPAAGLATTIPSPPRHDLEDPKQKMRAFDGEVAIDIAPFYSVHILQHTLLAGFIAPCLPTKTDKLPSGSQWLHEIKHDCFRIIARKNSAQVRAL